MPHLHLTHHRALEGVTFELVEARVEWVEGRTSTGWGRASALDVAARKAFHEAVERHAYTVLPAGALLACGDAIGERLDPGALVRHAPWQWDDPALGLRPFRADEPAWWLQAKPVQPASSDEATWVLADALLSPRAFEQPYRGRLVTHASSSGFATAATLDDALLHATLELVERDALMRHWLAQRPGRRMQLARLPQGPQRRLARLAEAGCYVGLQWLDMGAHPVWLAWAQHAGLHFTSIGSACGLDAELALDSALGELETQALPRLEGVPPVGIHAEQVRTPSDHASLYATRAYYRVADCVLCPQDGAFDRFEEASAAFTRTRAQLYEALHGAGRRPWWVDLSIPEANGAFGAEALHTVRAVVPHAIPLSFGYRRQPAAMDCWHRLSRDDVHPYV